MRCSLRDHHPRSRALHDEALFLGDDSHLGGKTVAPAWDRNNVLAVAGGIPQRLSQHEDLLRQVGLLDKRVGPDQLHQIVLQNYLLALAHQHEQGLKRFQL